MSRTGIVIEPRDQDAALRRFGDVQHAVPGADVQLEEFLPSHGEAHVSYVAWVDPGHIQSVSNFLRTGNVH